ncbi:helix-turn-helix transcriptional regulator [Paenibacillus elgii]|uniref:helix-turn-helix transcriptional regulator n=1 Tax=Paenibacillus elgii TaxID=189691 RepID=UPI000248D908|nr:hypothetical protein [Paenibacillus elgii]
MRVTIKETDKLAALLFLDQKGYNHAFEFISEHGGLEQFTYDASSKSYHCSEDAYTWWNKVLEEHEILEDRVEDLKTQFDSEIIQFVVGRVPNHGLEDYPDAVHAALDKAFGDRDKPQIPPLVGLSEAAEILGWSKQQINVYLMRGKFPEPIQRLASGPIWTQKRIEDYRDSRK